MKSMETFEAKDGKHKGELVVVIEVLNSNENKCLTLEGDIHHYNDNGFEVVRPPSRQGLPWEFK